MKELQQRPQSEYSTQIKDSILILIGEIQSEPHTSLREDRTQTDYQTFLEYLLLYGTSGVPKEKVIEICKETKEPSSSAHKLVKRVNDKLNDLGLQIRTIKTLGDNETVYDVTYYLSEQNE